MGCSRSATSPRRTVSAIGSTFSGTKVASIVYGGLPDATNEESVKCLQKAIDLNPDNLIHYIELGRTYAQMGKNEDAKKLIEKGLAMPDKAKDDPEVKKMGRETLGKL